MYLVFNLKQTGTGFVICSRAAKINFFSDTYAI